MHREFIVGIPLSFYLNPIKHETKIKSENMNTRPCEDFLKMKNYAVVPKIWQLNLSEKITWIVLIL